jgi:two-component system KDP operon response regulator KdpE
MKLLLVQGKCSEGDVFAEEFEQESVLLDVVKVRDNTFSKKGVKRLASKAGQSGAEAVVLVMTGEKKLIELLPLLVTSLRLPVFVIGNEETGDCEEEIACLTMGAGDYVLPTTPVPVMIVRLQRLIQLYHGICQPFSYQKGLVEQSGRRDYLWQSTPLGLTGKEYEILHILLHSREDVVPKEELLQHVWHKEAAQDSFVLTTMIRKLRLKLKHVPVEIVNHYGRGYSCRWT